MNIVMKFHKYLLASLLAASAMAGFSACDEDQDYPPVVCPDLGGDGKAATPLTVSGGRALYTQEFSSSRSEIPYWVTGYIVGIIDTKVSNTASPTSATFTAPFAVATNILIAQSPDCADYEDCLCVQLKGAVRTALNLTDNPANLGKRVTIRGYFEKYCSMAGMKDCDMYNWGDEPTPPAPVEGQIYSALAEGDAALTEGWTIDNVNLGSLSRVWSWKEYSGKHYLNGSGYSGSAVACEAYAVSPVIDLTGVTEAAAAFDHAAKFQTTLRTLCGLVVREEGATAWTMLTIPTWPEAGSWAFANSGSVDLSAYNGKKIQIAFKYASTAEGADTWEIKNLVVTGKK